MNQEDAAGAYIGAAAAFETIGDVIFLKLVPIFSLRENGQVIGHQPHRAGSNAPAAANAIPFLVYPGVLSAQGEDAGSSLDDRHIQGR